MNDEFLYNGETEVLIQTFAEETSKIPLLVEGKTFYASLVYDFIYRYGLKAEFLANFLGVSEVGLLDAIGEFVEELKSKINEAQENKGIHTECLVKALVTAEMRKPINKSSESD